MQFFYPHISPFWSQQRWLDQGPYCIKFYTCNCCRRISSKLMHFKSGFQSWAKHSGPTYKFQLRFFIMKSMIEKTSPAYLAPDWQGLAPGKGPRKLPYLSPQSSQSKSEGRFGKPLKFCLTGVNFTNILQVAFFRKVFCAAFMCL